MKNEKWRGDVRARKRQAIQMAGRSLGASLLTLIALAFSLFGQALPGGCAEPYLAISAPFDEAFAQEEEWSEPVLVSASADGTTSWFPDVAVDRYEKVHVVWDSATALRSLDDKGLALTMYAVRLPNGSWSEPNDIATGASTEVSRPAIAIERADLLHMVFRPSGDVYYSQANIREAHSAQAWRHPHRLDGGGANYAPDVAVDSQGTIHTVWPEQIPLELSEEEIFRNNRFPYLSDIFYRRSMDGGRTWSTPTDLSRTPNAGSGRVQIKVDTQDGIHVVWDEGWDRNAQNDIAGRSPVCGMYVHSRDGGHTWSAPKIVDMPQITNVHQDDAYTHYERGLRRLLVRVGRHHPRYSEALAYQKQLVDNISQARESEEDMDTLEARGNVSELQRLTLEAGQNVLKAERDAIINLLNDLASSVLGISFDELCDLNISDEVIRELPQADNAQMTLGLDDKQDVLLIWRSIELQRIYYTWSEDSGETWSAVEEVPGIYARPWNHPFDTYDMATDSLGRIHLVMVGTTISPDESRSPPLSVYHLSWDGNTWSPPQVIAFHSWIAKPENPKIAIERGNHLHVVWYLRPEGDWERNTQVWYSELEVDAPAQEPVPSPIPTATPTLTPMPVSLPTATPFPTLGPDDSSVSQGLYTENDDLIRLALALSPVTVILLTIAVLRFGPSRRRE